ncbi:hypothetical protein [uncultured Treponema sp.]|uniref:hypothetical protein n=1 Tax=uncultured Treponema sp. TaxID=162155 RepID=UPI0025CF43BE|nr:hypothetical protein [uncultured Treponema sp.]
MTKSKYLIAFFSVLLSFVFISCESKSLPSLLGSWEAEITLKSELGSKDTGENVDAFLFTKQKITLSFSEGGVFTKHIVQKVDRLESNVEFDDVENPEAYFAQFFNKDLTFDGEYSQKKSYLFFTIETVREGEDEALSYMDYFVKDPSIGDDESSSSYEVKDGVLVIDGVNFKKIL